MKTTNKIEIDLSEFSKEILIKIIMGAHESDLTFNQFIVKILEATLAEMKLSKIEDENQLPLL